MMTLKEVRIMLERDLKTAEVSGEIGEAHGLRVSIFLLSAATDVQNFIVLLLAYISAYLDDTWKDENLRQGVVASMEKIIDELNRNVLDEIW